MTQSPAVRWLPDALWLVVPVKPFAESKSRLAPELDTAARAALSRDLLRRVLLSAQDAGLFAGMLVVSRDPEALQLAALWGATPLPEQGAGLNTALAQARSEAMRRGADALLVLPADLPAVTGADLRTLVAALPAPPAPALVIAPSDAGGTNALLLRPADALDFAYGPESAARHCAQAGARGLEIVVLHSAALAFDVDLPDDLARLAVQTSAAAGSEPAGG